MNRLNLGLFIFLTINCSPEKTNSEDANKDIVKKPGGYCLQDFDCRTDMEKETFDTTWIDVLGLKIELSCDKHQVYTDTVLIKKEIPCDSSIYRYVHNVLTVEHSFRSNKKVIVITTQTLREFLNDKKLVNVGYVGNNYSVSFNKGDTSVSIRLPVYFREIDIGEIATIAIAKDGIVYVTSVEKYAGFVPE
jgi:hypothetical protein